jgi:hypothetical protein
MGCTVLFYKREGPCSPFLISTGMVFVDRRAPSGSIPCFAARNLPEAGQKYNRLFLAFFFGD